MFSKKHDMEHSTVTLYGKCASISNNLDCVLRFAENKEIGSISLIVPPINSHKSRSFEILERFLPNRVCRVQGAVLKKPRQAVIIQSRDCPTVTIENKETGEVGVVHAGREQLINRFNPCLPNGVIEFLMPILGNPNGDQLNAYITGGICAKHFGHQDESYIQPFEKLYGSSVITSRSKLKLDLVAVITAILQKYGVPLENIKHDGLCTYSTDWLGSKRAGKNGVNWTIVVKH